MNYLEQIAEIRNLYWAWEKTKSFYQPGDIWFDELEVSTFEINLRLELISIQKDILDSSYQLRPIFPVAFPKAKDVNGPRTRQTFWLSVRDQVTWMAVTNIIGKDLDYLMPFWSYGNRLYISTFYDSTPNSSKPELKFGYYRNTTGNTYRKWIQSWPLYRRHVNLTTKFLSGKKKKELEQLDEKEHELIQINDSLSKTHPLKVSYIDESYWTKDLSGELYWASVDLEKFYPSLNLEKIIDNIREYLPDQKEEFYQMIESLLAFSVDTQGWGEDELLQINVTEGSYKNLPTGLFVAGFLANVAMLKIDKVISRKLEQKRDIAHFRYVDDHLILSSSFEDLVTWIKEYQKIITEHNLGTNFNINKTEPKLLSEYLEKGTDQKTDDTFYLAKNATQLDPEFPSPLMTQTLAKVSKIIGTEFQLLGAEEERNLIGDIEHLLLTEFPDQELRKDTRVAFAARMLSTLVPQMTYDLKILYSLESKCTHLVLECENERKKGKDVKSIEKEIEGLKNLISHEKQQLEEVELKMTNRTVKLLSKAIRENHQKVRLWSRIIEFLSKSGGQNIDKLFIEIQNLKKKEETNDLSVTYLHSLILEVITQSLFKAYRILESHDSSFKQRRRSSKFINGILKPDVFNYFETNITQRSKPYEKTSLDLFKYCAGTILYLTNPESTELVKKYGLIDWKNPQVFCNKTSYDLGIWLWWMYSLIQVPTGKRPYLWDESSPHLTGTRQSDRAVILLFPKHLTVNLLEEIEKNHTSYKSNEGWCYEVYRSLIDRKMNTDYDFINLVKRKDNAFKSHITLYEWIDWTHNTSLKISKNISETTFDPRISEWMSLKIIVQIAKLLKSKIEEDIQASFMDPSSKKDSNSYDGILHPHNLKIDAKWIEFEISKNTPLTWEGLRSIVESKPVTFRAQNDLIYDQRLVIKTSEHWKVFEENELKESIVSALGTLLVCLLTKSTDLPVKWNSIGSQFVRSGAIMSKLNHEAISSFTRDIINGSFSKRNKETGMIRILETIKGNKIVKDNALDPPYIPNINEFIKLTEYCLLQLEHQQLAVSNHQPRQLTPINLKQLTSNDYQEIIDEL